MTITLTRCFKFLTKKQPNNYIYAQLLKVYGDAAFKLSKVTAEVARYRADCTSPEVVTVRTHTASRGRIFMRTPHLKIDYSQPHIPPLCVRVREESKKKYRGHSN